MTRERSYICIKNTKICTYKYVTYKIRRKTSKHVKNKVSDYHILIYVLQNVTDIKIRDSFFSLNACTVNYLWIPYALNLKTDRIIKIKKKPIFD